MNVDINETGKHGSMMKIDGDNARGGGEPAGNRNNTALRHRNVNKAEATFREQHGIFQQTVQMTHSFSSDTQLILRHTFGNYKGRQRPCQYGNQQFFPPAALREAEQGGQAPACPP